MNTVNQKWTAVLVIALVVCGWRMLPAQSQPVDDKTQRATDDLLRRRAFELIERARDSLVPPGTIVAFAGTDKSVPKGWMLCDGRELSVTEHRELYSAIGTAWGGSAETGKMRVPDLRGRFLRGVDMGKGRDLEASGRTAEYQGQNHGDRVGSLESDAASAKDLKIVNAGAHDHELGGRTSEQSPPPWFKQTEKQTEKWKQILERVDKDYKEPGVVLTRNIKTIFMARNNFPQQEMSQNTITSFVLDPTWTDKPDYRLDADVPPGTAGPFTKVARIWWHAWPSGLHSHSVTSSSKETRPVNASVHWIIKD